MNFNETLILENEFLRLEPLQMEHYPHLLPISETYPDLLRYSPSPFGGADNLRTYLEIALEARAQGSRYPFAIFDKGSQTYIGSTSFGNYSKNDARIEIGWTWINRSLQGSGINRKAKELLLTYAFESLALMRVEFKTDFRNKQSRRALEKIGASFEGTLRSNTLMQDGHYRDTCFYSILKSEWPEIKRSIFLNQGPS